MSNLYRPVRSRIRKIVQETDIDYTFFMEYDGTVKPGQFFEVSIPKYGEAPISVSEIGADYIGLTIRRVGVVTNTIHELTVGDSLFLRGPYGNGFDLENYKNKEVVIVAGGTGLAPVKGLIDYFAEHPQETKGMTVLAGFKTTKDVLFRDSFPRWEKNANVMMTVEKAEEYDYQERTGLVTCYVPQVLYQDKTLAQVIVVGPPIMIQCTAAAFLAQGISEENLWVSYERKMCCGVGKCGHCKMDDTYICLEGPVFIYAQAKHLID